MTPPLHLFEAFGIELEYMIVERETLNVLPCCDELMRAVTGRPEPEYEDGDLAWSNELALHVVEMKTNGPAPRLDGLDRRFHRAVQEVSGHLGRIGACLLPTAMHPWMDPHRETRLWPHEYTDIYRAYDRIFDCRGHGWSNVQSTHVNLPFHGDEEFARLHGAIRLVLPLVPALAASSPLVDGRITGLLDNRLDFYRTNQQRVPSISGLVIPENLQTEAEYRRRIFDRIRADIAPLDPAGILSVEFLNSRGAIARFERGAVEIRLIDIQECPQADLAIAAFLVELIRALSLGSGDPPATPFPGQRLAAILDETIRHGDRALIQDGEYLRTFGCPEPSCTAAEFLRRLAEDLAAPLEPWSPALRIILSEGPLARRILRALPESPTHGQIHRVYRQLGQCLMRNQLFLPLA